MSETEPKDAGGPFAEQRRIFDLLSQETRHLIIQEILGHPKHLVSLAELEYMVGKTQAALKAQLENLIEADIVAQYIYGPSKGKRDLPSKFYGFTEHSVQILYDYKYLRGLPVARALYDQTRKTEKIERHEAAPRPELPKAVAEALDFDEPEPEGASPDQDTSPDAVVDADGG